MSQRARETEKANETSAVTDDAASLEYAWNWFSYHANQRFAAFNFFVVFAGGIAVAYLGVVEKGWYFAGAILAGFGLLMSIGFALLDTRNRELVECSRQALSVLESKRGLKILSDSRERTFLKSPAEFGVSRLPQSLLSRVTKHGFIFQTLQYVAAMLFAVAIVITILA